MLDKECLQRTILAKLFFHDVGLSDTLAYPDESQSDFIQILNVTGTHWVCLTNKDCKPATAKVNTLSMTGIYHRMCTNPLHVRYYHKYSP